MRVLVSSHQPETAGTLRDMVREIDREHAVDVIIRAARSPRVPRSPDLILLDIDDPAPRHEGALIRQLVEDHPGARIVATGSRSDDAYVKSILELGVLGYLPRIYSRVVSLGLLRLAFGGPPVAHIGSRRNTGPRPSATPSPPPSRPSLSAFGLTARKIEVLQLVAEGKSNHAIAKRLGITEGTVKLHLTAMFQMLGVRNRIEAAQIAARLNSTDARQLHQAQSGVLDLEVLLPHMSHRHVGNGAVLFRKGESGGELCYVQRGRVRLEEIGVELGHGAIFGEIGIFSPSHERTCTAVCATDVDLFVLTAEQAWRLFLKDPRFALCVLHLIVKHLMADRARQP
ncbi:MAG TPA: LuxR C-terminal-related transcriptional regulator [Burkholderiales bacterium]|nr:LuxR C-terminal-related transcriptional regulator [Burkholderiales bacterium]